MYRVLSRKLGLFKNNEAGQFSVVFAILGLPLLAIASFAVDHNFAYKKSLKLQNALDDTALASVLNQNLTEEERIDYATHYFESFFQDKEDIEFKISESSTTRISLTAETKVPTSIMAITGKDDITVSAKASAEITQGSVVCMLTLDPDGRGSFVVTYGATFEATTCSVQVNSTHGAAASVRNGGQMIAKDICISGGAVGDNIHGAYVPFANTECSAIADPYEHRRIPAPGPCQAPEILEAKLNDWMSRIIEPTEIWVDGQSEIIEGGVTLEPGTYCGGLDLTARHINFAPGEYIIQDGPLLFGSGTKAVGEGVTFIFAGLDANLLVADGSHIDLSAPTRGDLEGLVFAQYLETQHGVDAILPSANSVIRSGGTVKITGTTYLPTHKISFIGGSISEAQAPATSFISYQIRISDGASINVAVDHQAAGLPPILPRSDESARLVE